MVKVIQNEGRYFLYNKQGKVVIITTNKAIARSCEKEVNKDDYTN